MQNLAKYFIECSETVYKQEIIPINIEVYQKRNTSCFLNSREVEKIKDCLYDLKEYPIEKLHFRWTSPPVDQEEWKTLNFTLNTLNFNTSLELSKRKNYKLLTISISFDKKKSNDSRDIRSDSYELEIKKSTEDWFFVHLTINMLNFRFFRCDGVLGLLKLIDFLVKDLYI